jgi:hypothetical protein
MKNESKISEVSLEDSDKVIDEIVHEDIKSEIELDHDVDTEDYEYFS